MHTLANAFQSKLGIAPTGVTPRFKVREGGETMKALAWFGKKDVKVIDSPIPDITQPDDVIVKVTGTTICGSDLHLYRAEILTLQKGDILGHEFMGEVDRVGSSVKSIRPGQRVVVSFQIACGKCSFCKQKLSSMCDRTSSSSLQEYMYGRRDAGFFGYSHFTGGFAGGQAEYVRVPFGEVNCLVVPDGVKDEQALYLSDVLPTSYHAVVDTGVKKGEVVGVWGLGPIGLCVAKWALIKGASRVIGIDKDSYRLAQAEMMGIDTVDFSIYADVAKRIAELAPDGLDVAIDAATFHEPKTVKHKVSKALSLETDASETLNETFLAVKKMGRVGIIAAYAGYTNGLNIGAFMDKGIRLIGNGQAPVHLYWNEILKDYIIPGKFDPTFMITHRVPLEDMAKLYRVYDKREVGILKVFVETKASSPPMAGCPKTSSVDDWGREDPGVSVTGDQ